MAGLPLSFGVEIVELHALTELVALEIQQLRRAALIPLGSIRGTQYQGSLELLHERLERDPGAWDHAGQRLVDASPERGVLGRARARRELQVVRLEHLGLLQ